MNLYEMSQVPDACAFALIPKVLPLIGSFLMQAFVVSTTKGALFAQVTQAGSHADWKILKKGWGDSWKVIGKMQRRPTSQDLETAFYNASAAESPLTAGIRAVRQLVPSKKDAK